MDFTHHRKSATMKPLRASHHDVNLSQQGFTLAEMAIVVVLIGIVVTMGLRILTAQLGNTQYADTANKQAQIKLALIAYLRSTKYLPCPDTSATPNGTAAANCNASANASYGVVPWATLGLPRDVAVDGFGNFFRYKVANGVAPVAKNWTTNAVLASTFDISELAAPSAALTIKQGDGVAAPVTISTTAVVAIVSAGKNGFGARTVRGQVNSPVPAANTDETTNAAATGLSFVVRPYNETTGAFGGPIDDVVVYMNPSDLLGPLVTEQTMTASCRSYCKPCTGSGLPHVYCTGPNTPASAVGLLTCQLTPGSPYAGCNGLNKPVLCNGGTTGIPVGNPGILTCN